MRFLLLVFLFITGCAHKQPGNSHGHHSSHSRGDANRYMLQSEHEELIKRFDDPSRDEWQKPQRVLELMGPLSGKRIIDIGAGSGYFTNYFLKASAYVTAADVDSKFLEYLQQKFPAKSYPKLTVSSVDYDDPKMRPDTFDYAFTSNTYHHIEDRIEYLKKVKAGLKVGGSFVVVDFKTNPKGGKITGPPISMRVPITKVIEEMLAAGFDHLTVYDRELDQQYIVIGLRTF